jgi:hypothetical protein
MVDPSAMELFIPILRDAPTEMRACTAIVFAEERPLQGRRKSQLPSARMRYVINVHSSEAVQNRTHVNTTLFTQNGLKNHFLKLWQSHEALCVLCIYCRPVTNGYIA